MAVKKSTANQREDRTPAPKIPAVIAKPAAKPAQTLNVYGSPATSARPVTKTVVQPTVTKKSTIYYF